MEHRQTAVVYKLAHTEQNWAAFGLGPTPSGDSAGDGSSEPPSSRSDESPWAEPLSHGSRPTFLALKPAAVSGPLITLAPQRRGACASDGRAGDGSADDGASSGTTNGCGTSIVDRGVHGGSSSSISCTPTSRTLSCLQRGAGSAGDVQGASRLRHQLKEKRATIQLAEGWMFLRFLDARGVVIGSGSLRRSEVWCRQGG